MDLGALRDCPRPLLALDASGPQASVALVGVDGAPIERTLAAHALPSEGLIAAIAAILADAQLRVVQLRALAVGIGPGSYTGLRVALASAKGLALGAGVPLYAFSSLAMLAASTAQRFGAAAGEGIVVARDALRGSVYLGLYRVEAHHVVAPAAPDALCALDVVPAQVRASLGASVTQITGDCATPVAKLLGLKASDEQPRALMGLFDVAHDIRRNNSAALAALVPNYLRPSLSAPHPSKK